MSRHASSRFVTASKAAACAALIWFLAQQPPAAIAKALFYSLFAWAAVAAIVVWMYFLVSVDDVLDVLSAALRTSSAAMWLAPAILLLSMRVPVAEALALLLIANTMRLLFSRSAPRERAMAALPPSRRSHPPMFLHSTPVPGFMRETLPVILGAIALQVGAGMAWAGDPIAAAGLIAAGATVLTSTSVTRGAYRRKQDSTARASALSVVLTLLLAAALSVGRAAEDSEPANMSGFMATALRIAQQLTHAPDAKRPGPRSVASLIQNKAVHSG